MLDTTFRRSLQRLLDSCLKQHLLLESEVLSTPDAGLTRLRQSEQMLALLAAQFDGIDRLIGDDQALYLDARDALCGHDLFRHVLLQAGAIAHLADGGAGAPFNFRSKRLILDRPELGYSAYAEMLNQAIFDLPLCHAIRRLGESLAGLMEALPAGSRVLGIDAGTASEVMMLPPEARGALDIELWESDAEATAHVARYARAPAPRLRGEWTGEDAPPQSFDLIYAPDLLARAPRRGAEAERLVKRAFGLLRPGGRLVLGCLLRPGGPNPHRHSHRMLLENGADGSVVHRSPAEIVAIAGALAPAHAGLRLLADDLDAQLHEACAMGALCLDRHPSPE